ncbi:hypothetical protein HZA99_00015 [Candidatus Woesearchaeota archaeon]|nr:hypothetical protein [Candidatus Woesearchaeota archaeon]
MIKCSMMKKTKCAFLCILVFFLLISSCAEKYASPESEKRQIGKNNILPEDNQKFHYIEEFKQYTVDENGDRDYVCNVPNDIPLLLEGRIHTVWSAVSDDGSTWKDEQYVMRGSVPEVIYFNNKYYMFVMGKCLMYVSDNGIQFNEMNYTLKADNLPEDFKDFGVDPTAAVVNGTIHLFFYEPEQTAQPVVAASIKGDHKIIQYVSEDAVTWKRVGEAIAVSGITDPDIVYYGNEWYLFMSIGQSAKGAVSKDAVTFSLLNNGNAVETQGGVPDTIVFNGVMNMYAHRDENGVTVIKRFTSTDGIAWQDKGTVLEDGEAPSVVQLPDGTFRMYYVKRLSEEKYKALVAE